MSASQSSEFQREFDQQLRERREALRQAVEASLRAMGEEKYAREVGDMEDQALADWMQEQQVVDLHHDARELTDIEDALERIRQGCYGVCPDCGLEIPLARLRAYPTAKRCLECQTIRELRRREFDLAES